MAGSPYEIRIYENRNVLCHIPTTGQPCGQFNAPLCKLFSGLQQSTARAIRKHSLLFPVWQPVPLWIMPSTLQGLHFLTSPSLETEKVQKTGVCLTANAKHSLIFAWLFTHDCLSAFQSWLCLINNGLFPNRKKRE